MSKTMCIAGKNDIAVDILANCINNYKEYQFVCITNRNETGVNSWQKSLKWFANKNKIDICKLEDIYDIADLIFISAEFDTIIKPDRFKSKNLFNIHFSLLPKYKGVYTSAIPILNGDDKTGVTLHRIRSGIDTGEIIDQEEVSIDIKDTSFDVYKKLTKIGTEVVIRNLPILLSGNYSESRQKKAGSTYYSLSSIDYSNLKLDVNCTAYQILNQIRAFTFRPYQIIQWNGNPYVESEILDQVSEYKPGTILEDNDIFTIISTIDYNLKLYKDVMTQLFDAINDNNIQEAKRYCSCREILKSQDSHGWSALTVAVYNNNLHLVKFLVAQGSDINVTNNNGTTLLMYAKDVGLKTGDWQMFRFLIGKGLDALQKDYSDNKIIDYLEESDLDKIPDDIKVTLTDMG